MSLYKTTNRWNTGLTKETDIRVKKISIKLKERYKNNPRPKGEKNPCWKGGSRGYWQKRSREVWEKYYNRKIPKGYLIHHKDENWKNINPENLKLMRRKVHAKYHGHLYWLKINK